jgi:hypothetical protein
MSVNPSGSEAQGGSDESTEPQRSHPAAGGGELVHSRELLDFLATLGLMMRSSEKAAPARERPVPPARRRSLLPVIAAAAVLLFALVRAPLWRSWSQHGSVPEQFLGSWATTAAPYADRGFVISRDSLWLRLGHGQSAAYPIVGVRRRWSVDSALYTLHYRDGASSLELGLRMERDTTVHIANLPTVVWKKESR